MKNRLILLLLKRPASITSVEVSGIGPFVTERPLSFDRKVTLVVGDFGTGKSTIARALVANWAALQRTEEGINVADLAPFLAINEECEPPFPGESWKEGARVLHALNRLGFDDSMFARCFESNIREIMKSKIEVSSKFGHSLAKSHDLAVNLSEDFTVDICETTGGCNLNSSFQAAGERTVLLLAAVGALRKVLPYGDELPIVWDDFGGLADSVLCSALYSFVLQLDCQVILLMSRTAAARLRLVGDIDLSWQQQASNPRVLVRQPRSPQGH